ncbi:hypothetical protein PFWH6_1233 [Pseudomonas fluorescens WH6]|nr:hypothetical protein PFWH6_1233 [Pseudomonas fluorescens WH6]
MRGHGVPSSLIMVGAVGEAVTHELSCCFKDAGRGGP